MWNLIFMLLYKRCVESHIEGANESTMLLSDYTWDSSSGKVLACSSVWLMGEGMVGMGASWQNHS